MLESGQVLAAAGTPGSVREDVCLSAGDRKRLGARVTVITVEEPAEATESAEADADRSATKKAARKSE